MMSVLGKKNMHIQGVFEQVANLGDPGREGYTPDCVQVCHGQRAGETPIHSGRTRD